MSITIDTEKQFKETNILTTLIRQLFASSQKKSSIDSKQFKKSVINHYQFQ